mgnify:CR=1 FL=1
MTGNIIPMADPLQRKDDDKAYCVGWRHRYEFEKGCLGGPITYKEAREKAKEMAAQEPEKPFWPELMFQ